MSREKEECLKRPTHVENENPILTRITDLLIQQGKSQPLNNLTQGIHYHTITARSQDILDEVKKSLDKMGILC